MHLQYLIFLIIEMDEIEITSRIIHIQASIHQHVNQWDNGDKGLSFMEDGTLMLYFFRIFIRICTFGFYLIFISLSFIYHNFRNHIFLIFHFEILRYFIF
jgi:hypothetical protein